MDQADALTHLMLNAPLRECPNLPARTLPQRVRLVLSTLRSLAATTDGEAFCVVTGDFFPGHHGDFKATVVRSKWDGLRATRAGCRGIVLRAAPGAGSAISESVLPIDDAGHVRGSFTRNNLFQLFGRRHGVDVVIHAGSTDSAHQSLARHYQGLTCAARVLGTDSGIRIPEVLEFGPFGGVQLLVQCVVSGQFLEPREISETEIRSKVDVVLEALGKVFLGLTDRHSPPESDFLNNACERMRLALDNRYVAELIDQVRDWQRQTTVGSTLCHGDLWFPNIVFPAPEGRSDGRIGLIDWEWARTDGVPGYDALHLVALVVQRVCRVPIGRAFRMISDPESLPAWAEAIVASILRTYGLDRADLDAVSRLLLLIRIWQGHFVTYSGGQDWLTALIRAYRGEAA